MVTGSGARVRIEAELKHVTGSRDHRAFMLGRRGLAPLPDPVALRILSDGAGFALSRLDAARTSIEHTWHPTLDEAKAEAARGYGVGPDDWRDASIAPPGTRGR